MNASPVVLTTEGAKEHELRIWSLFTGVGGFDLGIERAGGRVVLQCEAEEWRRRVLASRFPAVQLHDDVRSLHGTPGAADVLCGGFPCQDLSVAGRRAGLSGERSGLFFEFARIAAELELAEHGGWIWLENVPGLLSSNGGRDFGIVLETLADLGFAVGYRVLDSRFFGVPQRRRRVFIVGHPRAEYARAVLFDSEGSARSAESGGAPTAEVAGTLGGGSGKRGWCDDFDRGGHTSLSGLGDGGPDDNDAQAGRLILANTLKAQNGRGWSHDCEATYAVEPPPIAFHQTQDPISSEEATPAMGSGEAGAIGVLTIAAPLTSGTPPNCHQAGRRQEDDVNLVVDDPAARPEDTVRRLTPRECERLQGFPDDWTAVDGLPTYAQAKNGSWRCKQGTPDSRRYAAMGDAVTVNVIEWIAGRLVGVARAD